MFSKKIVPGKARRWPPSRQERRHIQRHMGQTPQPVLSTSLSRMPDPLSSPQTIPGWQPSGQERLTLSQTTSLKSRRTTRPILAGSWRTRHWEGRGSRSQSCTNLRAGAEPLAHGSRPPNLQGLHCHIRGPPREERQGCQPPVAIVTTVAVPDEAPVMCPGLS